MAASSMTDKFVSKLQAGKKLTIAHAMSSCGFGSPNSVYATVTRLRQEGYKIETVTNSSGTTAYSMR